MEFVLPETIYVHYMVDQMPISPTHDREIASCPLHYLPGLDAGM